MFFEKKYTKLSDNNRNKDDSKDFRSIDDFDYEYRLPCISTSSKKYYKFINYIQKKSSYKSK